jgi:hypothetical protein
MEPAQLDAAGIGVLPQNLHEALTRSKDDVIRAALGPVATSSCAQAHGMGRVHAPRFRLGSRAATSNSSDREN